jgi:signal peptidase II
LLRRMTPKLLIGGCAFLGTLLLDQASKLLVDAQIGYADRVEVIEGFFYLTHVRNPGAAFGLLSDGPTQIRLGFFLTISVVAIGIVLSFFRKLAPGDRLSALALGCILGGAVGNLLDRILRGEVVDFLHFRLWGGYSWPDFNFADSFIVTGVGLLILELLASEGESRATPDRAGPA